MKERVRGDTRRRRSVGLIIERVQGRREPCWSDGSAELKPSSGLPSCPADVKASAPQGEKGDAQWMLTAQGCLWNGQRVTASSTSFPWVNIYDNHKGKSSVISETHLSKEILVRCFYCYHAEYNLCKHIKMIFSLLPLQQNLGSKTSHLKNPLNDVVYKSHISCLA